jgi:hypothetical protein
MNNINDRFNNNMSPVEQEYVWYSENVNGEIYSEFDFKTKKENSFYNIDKKNIVRFGLIGEGKKLYYEINSGIFKLNGKMVEIIYKTDNFEYYLTGQNDLYRDLITYKDAESIITLNKSGTSRSSIIQFNFGYKTNLEINGAKFNFKPIVSIPRNKNFVYMNIRLTCNQNLNGKLLIKRNGVIVEEIEAPLRKNVGGELNWILN